MKKSIWKLVLYLVLCIVTASILGVIAIRTGSDYLRSLSIMGPATLIGYLASLESGDKKKRRVQWWQLALVILAVTTAFWLLEKYLF